MPTFFSRFRRPEAQPSAAHPLLLNAARRLLDARTAFVSQLNERTRQRVKGDLRQWRDAVSQAEHPQRPNRRLLLDTLHDAQLDAHLASILNTRRMRLLGATCHLVDAAGLHDPASEDLLRQQWFSDLVGHILDSLYYGFSVVELHLTDGELRASLVPRDHCSPEAQRLTLDGTAPVPPVGEPLPPQSPWKPLADWPHALVQIGDGRQLGLLTQAVPLVLLKRNALACWGEFAEVFGMPLRVGRTPARDEQRRQEMARVLEQMGSAAWAVLNDDERIDFQASSQSDAFRVYDRLVERANAELSKLINAQTLTTEQGDKGARSLGEIHDNLFDDLTRSDCRLVERVVNHQILPLLRQRFPQYAGLMAGRRLAFDLDSTVLSLREQWEIDRGLLAHFRIDPAYFRAKYGVPILEQD